MTEHTPPLDNDDRSDEQIDADNEKWQQWWDTASPCERRLWHAQVHVTYLQAERDALRQQLAAMQEREQTFQGLVTEMARATINRDNIYDIVRCEWCGGEWTSRRGQPENEVHTETCWVVRARVALAAAQEPTS